MPGKTEISNSLSYFVSQDVSKGFDNPFDDGLSNNDDDDYSKIRVGNIIEHDEELRIERKKKDKKKDKFSRIIEKGSNLVEQLADDELVYDFDNYIASYLLDDEDAMLKNSLISLGRKYARDTKTTGESSEIAKAYIIQEKALEDLLTEIEKDKLHIQKDIDQMRVTRSRNYKTLSELVGAKGQYHNIALSIIKEKNAITKTQFDLQAKSNKQKQEDNNNDAASSRAIQNLFGVGRNNIMSSVGGYGGVSGATMDDDSGFSDDLGFGDDDVIQQHYFANNNETETDGDKFLKYEGMGVEYVLLWDRDSNTKDVFAEDRDGNLIPDYPMPSNISALHFDISESTGSATDDLHRPYKLRIV